MDYSPIDVQDSTELKPERASVNYVEDETYEEPTNLVTEDLTPPASGASLWEEGIEEIEELADEVIAWATHEHEHYERSTAWFLTAGAVAVLLIGFGILAHSYLFVALVVTASFVLTMYLRRAPRQLVCAITPHGIQLNNRLYHPTELVSFAIHRHPDRRELSLEFRHRLTPHATIPLADADPEQVRTALARHIPELPHPEYAIDQIARILKL